MPRLLGERVMLREYRAEDIGDIRKWVNDAQTTRYLSTRFWPAQSLADSEEFLARMLRTGHDAYNFVIASREDERYLGQLDMFRVDWRLRCGELGMVIAGEADRGQGLGTEALGLMQAFAFQTLGLERLELEVHTQNLAARRCYVVPSAPGRRFDGDEKVTDLLYRTYHLHREGKDFSPAFAPVRERFMSIASELGLAVDIKAHLDEIEREIRSGASEDFCASRGEYLNGLLLADYLGFCFLDPKDFIFFSADGTFDSERTNTTLAELRELDRRERLPHGRPARRSRRPGHSQRHLPRAARAVLHGRDRAARGQRLSRAPRGHPHQYPQYQRPL